MKKILFAAAIVVLCSCGNKKNIPDVSKIKVDLTTEHFEKDFFALDTSKLDTELQGLFTKYQIFSVDFLQNILGSKPQPDTVMMNVRLFKNAYQNLYTEAEKTYSDFSTVEKEIKQGFQYVKYYFPKYPVPTKLVTYIGPWDAMFMLSDNVGGSGIMRDGAIMGIGLQLAMGSNFSVYKEGGIQELYPAFVSRRFDKKYIAANAMKVIIDDIYPSKINGKPLVEQMIESGKRLYLLDAFLPYAADSIKTGYTQKQLDGCYKNEANIWSFFITNDLLFTTEPAIVKDYMSDGPNTAALGAESPGFIGQFVGWQIVKKWMDKNSKKSIEDLLKTPAKEIFEQTKYKP